MFLRPQRLGRVVPLCAFILLLSWGSLPAFAQGGATLELTKTIEGDLSDIESGELFTYLFQYRCVSITEPCENVVVTDVLPPELSQDAGDVTLIGTIHTTDEIYDPATGTATWVFVNPLPAGSTGELRMGVRFPAGTTLEGTTVTNDAQIDADNVPNPVTSNSTSITAHATNQLFPQKSAFGGVPDEETVYHVELCRPDDRTGQLNMTNITMIDTLPNGATFVSASHGGVYDPGPPQTVTWNLPDFDVNADEPCITRTVTVVFESANGFDVGDTVTNEVTVTGTPLGAPGPVTSSETLPTGIVAPVEEAAFDKRANKADATWGEPVRYGFTLENTGNVSVDNALITETVPLQLEVQQVHTGNSADPGAPVTIRYQTNLNAAWTDVAGSPFTSPQTVTLALGPGEYVTMLQWDFGTLLPGFGVTGNVNTLPGFTAVLLTTDRSGNPVNAGDIVTNEAELTYETSAGMVTDTDTHDLLATLPTARPSLQKTVIGSSLVNPQGIITYRVRVRNGASSTNALVNPVLADLLDADVEFVMWSFDAGNTGSPAPAAPAPVFQQIDNYRGTGRTLLRWSWTGASAYAFEAGEEAFIIYQAQVKPGTPAGSSQVTNQAALPTWDTSVPRAVCPVAMDVNDVDGDGNTSEEICVSNLVGVSVNTQAVMESAKWVKGELDADWSRYPSFGLTEPDGLFQYRLNLFNVGNVSVTNLTIIDILPFIGDTGVIDPSQRLTEWQPLLESAVTAPPGVTVSYSTETNPCRPELVPSGPPGCAAPNWSTTPPADLTTVRALRFDFGSLVIAPRDEITLIWTMRAPSAALPGEIAWNSFGYVATRTDNGQSLLPSEPLKVGIAVIAGTVRGQKALMSTDGTNFVWSVTWINHRNPFPVRVQVTDPIPQGVTLVAGSLNCNAQGASQTLRCEYDAAANEIVWEGILESDQGATNAATAANEVTLSFAFQAQSSIQTLTNQSLALVDTDNDNDFSDENLLIAGARSNAVTWTFDQPPPLVFDQQAVVTDITLTKTGLPPFAGVGERAVWTLTVTNIGTVQAQNLVAVDTLPEGLRVIDVQTSGGTVNITDRTITVNIPVLDPGQQVVVMITTEVLPDSGLFITNRAQVILGGIPGASAEASILRVTTLPRTGESPWSGARPWIVALAAGLLLGGWRVWRAVQPLKVERP